MRLQENTLFSNRYQLERLLGRGGFSEVWLAKDNWTHLQIAIKVYAPGQGMDANGLQEFCGELANVFDLNHTNLLKPTHVDSWNDMPYLIMAYCSQGSLAKKIMKLSEAQIWKMIQDVASGLAYLHSKDVVHQDIKPDNILMDEFGNFLITDFGISTRARSTLRKSVIGGAVSGGTAAYMGPERFSRQPAPTKASDIWSFGAMVYELLEGNVPFGEVGGGLQKGGAEIPFITADVSDALKFTVYKMLSKETWDRPTAATLVTWAQNPQDIEIDYALLSDEQNETPKQAPQPSKQPKRDTVPLKNDTRETQRFTPSAAPHKPAIGLSLQAITAPPEKNKYHVVEVTASPQWSAHTPENASWLHCFRRSHTELTVWCDQNDTKQDRTAQVYINDGDNQASILVTQKTAATKKKPKLWVFLLALVLVPVLIIVSLALYNVNESRRVLKERHENVISSLNANLRDASLDNITALENAVHNLEALSAIENNSDYKGDRWHFSKKELVREKAQSMYVEADRKYQRAPAGTETERRNKEKRDRIAKIKNKL